eukprot:TRINITY_DN13882_c0_g1_i1.p1 TRINITY_DN13882_c0_g1~~TRINITY_DN13882_c0_g1_i1.p1  ORF type:complete len:466 (+),score=79.77 TRINITY_DN13882_c0_g1_i1:54-1451(+)
MEGNDKLKGDKFQKKNKSEEHKLIDIFIDYAIHSNKHGYEGLKGEKKKKKKERKIENMTKIDTVHCLDLLEDTSMFRYCTTEQKISLCQKMEKTRYKRGETILSQGERQDRMILLATGILSRNRTDLNGQLHDVGIEYAKGLFGSLHLLKKDIVYADLISQTDSVIYQMSSEVLRKEIRSDPDLAEQIIYSLSKKIRNQSKLLQTPLLEQHSKPTNLITTSIAASTESFYRSALNALLNARLTGKRGSLFPNMHIQTPARVLYINGIKGIRQMAEQYIDPKEYQYPNLVRISTACFPGLAMTPLSSLLEACNAGHLNKEPTYIRLVRGLVPRSVREIIFGFGLNQLSDYMEERVQNTFSSHPTISNAVGSLFAGIVAGYLSHIPHNLSTLKLLNPSLSYKHHFNSLTSYSENSYFVKRISNPRLKKPASQISAVLFPRGVVIRTLQIVGSFIILNGTINVLSDLF